ncbi:MAG: hypothetical protein NVSMB6_07240 [Burkholderiaceae bacterium]
MLQWRNTFSVYGTHFLDQCEDAVKLVERISSLLHSKFKLCQNRETFYIGEIKGHGDCSRAAWQCFPKWQKKGLNPLKLNKCLQQARIFGVSTR